MRNAHPPAYYVTRTIVRVVVWGGLFVALCAVAMWAGSALADDPAPCPVRVTPRGWETTTTDPVDLSGCRHPVGIQLHPGGSWSAIDPTA
jgi:hypothetical protein